MNRSALIHFALAIAVITLAGCRRDKPEPTPTAIGTPYHLEIPSNLPPMDIPADNPMTVEGVGLGRFLFYDERLSGDNGMSCATCHAPALAFTDGKAVSKGIDSIAGNRSAMPLINLGYGQFFFWDGRAASLEQQILQPVTNPIEMHETWPSAMSKLQADAAYPTLFANTFGTDQVDSLLVAKAIAQFIRTMISGNSPFDKFRRGEDFLSTDAQVGFDLFKKEGGAIGQIIPVAGSSPVVGQGGADCFHCHTEAAGLFTDEQFHNNGLDTVFADAGRAGVTNNPADMAKFKTPTLRNIMVTAPYMHDGRFATIDQVLDHYNSGGHASSTVDPFMKFTDPEMQLGLDPTKRQQIITFLNSLTDDEFLTNPAFTDPGPPHL
ncbi:MAG: cytochrome-c peroxidase [Flavobacteriales bacterium]|jgi:cytochrome c peroxidase|nr:cytochrome-c peroxidase [Flavobacteriales bacterium]MBK7248959.1 cytochrome-c peroxidase [Flavobacteriales bacterium]MBK7288025.1 cytochrome-c peroxidase [Flavobacteriales bacterium]MBK9058800.1 cytochrome-c peroxidase [Flavobacteriales bacterium]MBK9600009.1 cytochrome-c peroxidase [Flavobacteriales bacterium]